MPEAVVVNEHGAVVTFHDLPDGVDPAQFGRVLTETEAAAYRSEWEAALESHRSEVRERVIADLRAGDFGAVADLIVGAL